MNLNILRYGFYRIIIIVQAQVSTELLRDLFLADPCIFSSTLLSKLIDSLGILELVYPCFDHTSMDLPKLDLSQLYLTLFWYLKSTSLDSLSFMTLTFQKCLFSFIIISFFFLVSSRLPRVCTFFMSSSFSFASSLWSMFL